MDNFKIIYIRPLNSSLELIIKTNGDCFMWSVTKPVEQRTLKQSFAQFNSLEAAIDGYKGRNDASI